MSNIPPGLANYIATHHHKKKKKHPGSLNQPGFLNQQNLSQQSTEAINSNLNKLPPGRKAAISRRMKN